MLETLRTAQGHTQRVPDPTRETDGAAGPAAAPLPSVGEWGIQIDGTAEAEGETD